MHVHFASSFGTNYLATPDLAVLDTLNKSSSIACNNIAHTLSYSLSAALATLTGTNVGVLVAYLALDDHT